MVTECVKSIPAVVLEGLAGKTLASHVTEVSCDAQVRGPRSVIGGMGRTPLAAGSDGLPGASLRTAVRERSAFTA
jgi:hypothetical protein